MTIKTSTDPSDAIAVAILCLRYAIEDSTPQTRPLLALELAKLQRCTVDYDQYGVWHAHG